jgi:hypothetical protein
MQRISLAEEKEKLDECFERAHQGKEINIVSEGKTLLLKGINSGKNPAMTPLEALTRRILASSSHTV